MELFTFVIKLNISKHELMNSFRFCSSQFLRPRDEAVVAQPRTTGKPFEIGNVSTPTDSNS